MQQDRVKFFGRNDKSCGSGLSRSQLVIQSYSKDKIYTDVNDVIELHNISCFFENGLSLTHWSEMVFSELARIVKSFPASIGRYFGTVTSDNFLSIFESVDIEYTDDFWELIEKYKVFTKIDMIVFETLFDADNFRLYEILANKKTTDYFGDKLREYILSDSDNAELLMDKYLVEDNNDKPSINLPEKLTIPEMESLILQYIDASRPNLNYLSLILGASNEAFPISDETKLQALRKYRSYTQERINSQGTIDMSVEVAFKKSQIEEISCKRDGRALKVSYSSNWITDNLDYPTIMNNFIHLFGYVDWQLRSQHTHRECNLGIFERVIGIKGRNTYFQGVAFSQTQALSILQNISYRNILKENGICLEAVIKWFFDTYLKDEFKVSGFHISIPSESSSYLEKCRMIASETDGVLKQFKTFCKIGFVDSEFIQMSSLHLFFKDIPSLVGKKYIYGSGAIYNTASRLFFSDQCMLSFFPRIKRKYDTFYELLNKERANTSDYKRYQQEIEWLVENGFLQIGPSQEILLSKQRVSLLKDLFYNEVSNICYLNNYSEVISWMDSRGMLKHESTLFSIPEQQYLNYLMNRSEFSNGLDLRNKYLHGTQIDDESVHKNDYCVFLNVLVLVIIKINEEFCLLDNKGQKE